MANSAGCLTKQQALRHDRRGSLAIPRDHTRWSIPKSLPTICDYAFCCTLDSYMPVFPPTLPIQSLEPAQPCKDRALCLQKGAGHAYLREEVLFLKKVEEGIGVEGKTIPKQGVRL